MLTTELGSTLAEKLFHFANVVNVLQIQDLQVPEVVDVESGGAVLDCKYKVPDKHFTVRWYFQHGREPVYEWSPKQEPRVSGVLLNRLDMAYKISSIPIEMHRAFHIVRLSPSLSGAYTCSVESGGNIVNETRNMLVYSPEKEFSIKISKNNDGVFDVKCLARGLHPHPELTLEINSVPIAKQSQRVWLDGCGRYAAESGGQVRGGSGGGRRSGSGGGRVACRLLLPAAGYVALKEEHLHVSGGKVDNSAAKKLHPVTSEFSYIWIFILFSVIIIYI